MRFSPGLLLLVFSLQQILALNPEVSIKKCCPEGQIYNSAAKRCVQGTGESIIGQTVNVTTKITPDPLTIDSVNPLDKLELIQATLELGDTGLPSCPGLHLETHVLDEEADSVLTQNGNLIVSKYENGIGANPGEFTTEFCVDLDANKNKIAVMCDLCREVGKVCIDLCCPHGHHYLPNPDYDYYGEEENELIPFRCAPGSKIDFSKVAIWDHDKQILDWRQISSAPLTDKIVKPTDYVIVAPKISDLSKTIMGYTCPSEFFELSTFNDVGEPDEEFKILSDGHLSAKKNETYEAVWPKEDFCLAFMDADTFNGSYFGAFGHSFTDDKASVLRFYGCNNGVGKDGKSLDKDDWCRDFKAEAHPVFYIISTVFLIITLFVYLAEDSLRGSNVLFSRITMGFIINLTIALILFTVGAMHPTDERNNYTSCQVKAYFTLYCFLAFYCWMNAMCFNIWSKFASMQRQSLDEGKKFIRYLIYAQGFPLIITLIVLIVDKVGQKNVEKMEDQRYLPNMGQYSCFLGNGFVGIGKSYFSHPIFIYFQSVMLIMQGTNMYFLGSTMVIIRNAFKRKQERAEDGKERYKLAKREFNTIAKLSVIMGVFWIGEFISTAIGIEHCDAYGCSEAICYTQLVLDIPNLLAGFLIFLVTVFKKPVYLGLRKKAGELTSGVWKTQDRTGVSNIYSDSGTEMKTVQ